MPTKLHFPFPTPPVPGQSMPVAPGVHWIRMPLPFALDHINLWLLEEADGFTLVDCGYGNDTTRAVWEQHFAGMLGDRPLRHIVVTHCHPDHVGNAAWLTERFQAPVAMTHAEFLTAHAFAGQHSAYALAATVELFRRHGMAAEHCAVMEGRGNQYRRGVPELPLVFERLVDGDTVPAGGTKWRIIEGHGHSPEHASLHSADLGVLISGDMLLPRISTNVAVNAAEANGDPLRRFLDSLTAFEALPEETLILPSHGLPFRGIARRCAELRAHHDARLAELETALAAAGSDGANAGDLVPVLFQRELDAHQRFFAMGEAIAHLNHLWRNGRIDRSIAADAGIRFVRRSA